jgi:hypothetical protein
MLHKSKLVTYMAITYMKATSNLTHSAASCGRVITHTYLGLGVDA